MSSLKKQTIDRLIQIEGGYVNNPDDSGGETRFGITKAVASHYGYQGDMADMPRDLAAHIYDDLYWKDLQMDALIRQSAPVAKEIIDTAINMGRARAVIFLQRALNVLNDKGRLYDDLKLDGHIGLITLAALSAYLKRRRKERGEDVLLKALNCLQGAKYINLAEGREKDETFIYGWLKHRVSMEGVFKNV